MIGLDSNILVAHAIPDHPLHGKVRDRIDRFLSEGREFALTTGILPEFIDVVTDPKRFENPLTMAEALDWAGFWSDAEEVSLVSTDMVAHRQWLRWLAEHRLGRKRLLDTLIAATWHMAGVREIFTLNPGDFSIFGVFDIHSLARADS
jgi:predicted nucleic acid-binding protein